jgi:hypothetical protein
MTDRLRRPWSVTGSSTLRGLSAPAIPAPSTSPGAGRRIRRSEPEDARPRWSAKARPVPGPPGTSCRDRHRVRDSETCGQHVTLRRSAPPADHCFEQEQQRWRARDERRVVPNAAASKSSSPIRRNPTAHADVRHLLCLRQARWRDQLAVIARARARHVPGARHRRPNITAMTIHRTQLTTLSPPPLTVVWPATALTVTPPASSESPPQ